MRILFLDDDPTRHRSFAQKNIGRVVHHVYDFYEFTKALDESETFDEIWLDHDLSWEAAMGRPGEFERTGYDAACYLASKPEKHPRFVIIHSWNPVGALRMRDALRDAGLNPLVQPFGI